MLNVCIGIIYPIYKGFKWEDVLFFILSARKDAFIKCGSYMINLSPQNKESIDASFSASMLLCFVILLL